MIVLVVGLVLFLGIHFTRIVAPGWREAQIAKRGEGPWKGIYSLISLIGLGLIVWGYYLARSDAPVFYEQQDWFRYLAFIAMPIAFVIFFAGDFRAGYIKRAVKHPMLIGTIIWSATHLIGNGDLASILLFGSLLIWAVVCLLSVFTRPYTAPTEVVWWPDAVSIGLALLLTWLFVMYLHSWLFGVPLS